MEWLVIDSIQTKKQDIFFVITQCGKIKTITEVESTSKISKGDIFTPTLHAIYFINNNKNRTIKILSSACFSQDAWVALKML